MDNDDPLRPPTDAEIDAAESRLGMKFHPDYRAFLKSGGDVGDSFLEPAVILPGSGYLDLFDIAKSAWEEGVPKDLLPFVEDNGDYYCLNSRGEVLFWSHNGTTDEKWPNLANWRQRVCIEEQ
jgi:hypothetical protein